MKSQGLHELFKKIFSDEETKQRFVSDPESVIEQYSLSADEKRAVLTTHLKLGLITPDSQELDSDVGPTSWWV